MLLETAHRFRRCGSRITMRKTISTVLAFIYFSGWFGAFAASTQSAPRSAAFPAKLVTATIEATLWPIIFVASIVHERLTPLYKER